MLGSAEEADRLLRELADFAQSTPFELTGVRQNAKQLLAMGVSTKDLLPTLKSLGDVSAGLSIPLERLALNYGQVISQGKLTGRELRDFTVAGVPILAELARMLGKTNAQIQEMISDGAISADIVVQAFKNMSSEGGKFANLMEAQSQTLQGSRSNLRDATDQLGEVIGTIFIPALTAITKAIIPMVDSARAWVNENPKLAKGIGIVVTALVALIGVLGAVLPVLAVMKVSIATLGLTLGAFA
jgi:tape measure domain-containing protein